MNLAARLRLAMNAMFGSVQTVGQNGGWLVRAVAGGKTKSGIAVSEWTALNLPGVWACVTVIADAIAQLPVNVFKRTADGREALPDHPVAKLLNTSPNEDMGAAVLIGAVQMQSLLWGNGYAEIERTVGGGPTALLPMLSSNTTVHAVPAAGGRRVFYRTSISGRSYELRPDQVLHIRGQTFDGLVGISPVGMARNAIGMGLAMEEFGAKFFANDAKSGGFLSHPGKLGEKAIRNIASSFTDDQGGIEHAHRVKVLEEGMKYTATTIPPEDAQFLGSREFQIAEIARMYRVPLVLLQSTQGSTVWGTGIEQLLIGFVVWTIAPWLKRWEEELSRKLLTEEERQSGHFIKFNLNALMRGDMTARAQFYKAGITDGWMTRNEAREKEDMNPIDGLDEPMVPLNMTPGAPPAGEETGNEA